MRSNEVIARMSPEQAERFLDELASEGPAASLLVLSAVSEAFRLRPQFLRRQPRTRQAQWMRQVLGRRASASIAEEVLATYFLDHHGDLLNELLDALGLEHEEGQLKQDDPPCPPKKTLTKAVKDFLKGEEPERRKLLLESFAAQSAIDWPDLEALL
jgi:hypothetical protein